MRLFCKCLNVCVTVETAYETIETLLVETDTLGLSDDESIDQFFAGRQKLAAVPLSAGRDRKIERLPVFVGKRVVDSWDVVTCLLCDVDVYATTLFVPGRALVNLDLMKNETEIAECRNAAEYSPAFQILLPKMRHSSEKRGGRWSGSHQLGAQVSEVLTECLRAEQKEMDDRIRRFIDREHAKFDQFKAKAKSDRAILLSLLTDRLGSGSQSGGTGGGTGSSSLAGTFSLSGDEEENDSAVPSSPLSLNSEGHSPHTPLYGNEAPPDPSALAVLERSDGHRTRSNPASLLTWKRKRHSGGSGRPPTLSAHSEEQQDVFNLEEHELQGFDAGGQPFFSAANDEDAGDVIAPDHSIGRPSHDTSATQPGLAPYHPKHHHLNLCRSLPVAIAGPVARRIGDLPTSKNSGGGGDQEEAGGAEEDEGGDIDPNDQSPIFIGGADLARSMMALARSTRPRDDPEALFGERPHRRRFKSSADASGLGGRGGAQKVRVTIFNAATAGAQVAPVTAGNQPQNDP